jgi:hypothetical protein
LLVFAALKAQIGLRPANKEAPMARKPNYDFEKKERERLKAAKKAARAEEKAKTAETQANGAESSGDEVEERSPTET